MSQGLTQAIKESEPETDREPPVEREWVLVGTAHGLDTGLYTGDEAEKMGKYLSGSRNQQRPPRATTDRVINASLPGT